MMIRVYVFYIFIKFQAYSLLRAYSPHIKVFLILYIQQNKNLGLKQKFSIFWLEKYNKYFGFNKAILKLTGAITPNINKKLKNFHNSKVQSSFFRKKFSFFHFHNFILRQILTQLHCRRSNFIHHHTFFYLHSLFFFFLFHLKFHSLLMRRMC